MTIFKMYPTVNIFFFLVFICSAKKLNSNEFSVISEDSSAKRSEHMAYVDKKNDHLHNNNQISSTNIRNQLLKTDENKEENKEELNSIISIYKDGSSINKEETEEGKSDVQKNLHDGNSDENSLRDSNDKTSKTENIQPPSNNTTNSTTTTCKGTSCGLLPKVGSPLTLPSSSFSSSLEALKSSWMFGLVCLTTSIILIFFLFKLARMKKKKKTASNRMKSRSSRATSEETRRLDDGDDDDDDWTLYDVTPYKHPV